MHGADRDETARDAFRDAMDHDFGTPEALAGVFDLVRKANAALDAGDAAAAPLVATAVELATALGVPPELPGAGGAEDGDAEIDALVQVGHNAVIGANCLLCAHVAVGGSAEVGEGSVLGGQVGVADNITLGPGVVAGGATKILSSVPAGRAILGYPAVKMEQHVEIYKALRRLPRLMARVAGLEKAVSKEDAND